MNDITKPLLSIIVPTKNREKYAFFATKQVLSFPFDNIQIIIQNNSETNELEKMLSIFIKDKRLKYSYCERNISTIENFNYAVELCDGEYICAIGDDDGINPEIMKIVSWAKSNNIDAIKPGLQANYFWPNSGVTHDQENPDNGVLMVSKISSSINIDDPRIELKRLMNDGCQNYYERSLVKIYHGIVRRKCMEVIKEKTGNYFGGLSPDIYSVVALSSEISKVVSIEYPLTIPGVCKKSTSADSSTGRHTGKLVDAPHFNGHDNYQWAEEIPEFYSVYTIWGDSALAAVKDIKNKDLLDEFNTPCSSARLLLHFPKYSKTIIEHYFKVSKSKNITKISASIKLVLYLVEIACIYSMRRLIRKLPGKKASYVYMNNIENIVEAEKALQEYLNKNNLNIDKVIKKLDILHKLK